ncbi:hypothetical protein BcepSauron_001 [Burkholderia phage BcepSauron]|nr:hypothetical protein H1O17_gp001 [Burkholderia phage BcepSauron]QBQ74381.1 hypothetical protein BcepSauron_001 [Burkholderia phage BcepSauron]
MTVKKSKLWSLRRDPKTGVLDWKLEQAVTDDRAAEWLIEYAMHEPKIEFRVSPKKPAKPAK